MPDATLTIPCCFRSCFVLDVRVFLRPTPRSRALLAVRPFEAAHDDRQEAAAPLLLADTILVGGEEA